MNDLFLLPLLIGDQHFLPRHIVHFNRARFRRAESRPANLFPID
jgi:hypothetical protein